MEQWKDWAKVSAGPYQGKLELMMARIDESGYVVHVRDQAGNVIKLIPSASGRTRVIVNTGGAGIIAHLAKGPTRRGGFLATGSDNCLYHIESNGSQHRWQKTFGPGRFLSTVFSSATLDGYAEILGEGMDHQLAYACVAPAQDRDDIRQWENLGQPGEAGGKKGLNGSPAVVFDALGVHVLVRGQDNHLWHTFGKDNERQGTRSFGRWTNLGGRLTQVPVVIRTQKEVECFVIGENDELLVTSWDGTQWSDFVSLGGQLQGLPAAIYIHGVNQTLVFGRGAHDELWYCQRNGTGWQEWQSLGDGLTGDPAAWEESFSDNGEALISCMVLRQNGELWLRELQLTGDEYAGRTSRGA